MSYNQYRPQPINFLPSAIKNLMIVNGLFFLATLVFQSSFNINLVNILGLHYWTSPDFKIYQVFTHMFMHGGLGHIFSNMFALWMFGSALEHRLGAKRFLFFYFFTALGAAILYQTVLGIGFYRINAAIELFNATPTVNNLLSAIRATGATENTTSISQLQSIYGEGAISGADFTNALASLKEIVAQKLSIPTVGASGAVFGVLIAFAMYQPNTEIFFLFVPFPIKAKYFVGFYALMELYLGVQNNPGDNVAHFAHLGGALFGYILVKYWNKTNRKSFY